jgi:hypothetical protein
VFQKQNSIYHAIPDFSNIAVKTSLLIYSDKVRKSGKARGVLYVPVVKRRRECGVCAAGRAGIW